LCSAECGNVCEYCRPVENAVEKAAMANFMVRLSFLKFSWKRKFFYILAAYLKTQLVTPSRFTVYVNEIIQCKRVEESSHGLMYGIIPEFYRMDWEKTTKTLLG
jgi:hypothetical protein